MPEHRMLNGKKIMLTAAEEAAFRKTQGDPTLPKTKVPSDIDILRHVLQDKGIITDIEMDTARETLRNLLA